jgi:hypothetical protein
MTATRGGGSGNVALAFATVTSEGGGASAGLPASRATEMVDAPRANSPTGCAGSHFTSCLESLFKNVLVVVDNGRVRGMPLGPVTDYLAMLAVSQPRSLDGCAALPSVIDLLAPAACAGRDPPDGLTPADAAYLTALYAADPRAKKATQQSDMADRMARILLKAGAVPAKPQDDGP